MPSISETIRRLTEQQARHAGNTNDGRRLVNLPDFGSNPGGLAAKIHVPATRESHPALVVVLHGCTQSADAYDYGSGWSRLADKHGFVTLFPEQTRANNGNLCFNWFEPGDTAREKGEVQSIHQMIEFVCSQHDINRKRVFITGLSAGGAIANAMLATYPELFAGGAIIAGLPYGVASSVQTALERMRGLGLPSSAALSLNVLRASSHKGPWPTISVWQGSADHTVVERNARAIAEQWCGVHGLDYSTSSSTATTSKLSTTSWIAADGFVGVEVHTIGGMGHGTPIDASSAIGNAGPFMLDVGISSTAAIARNWGLTPSFGRQETEVGLDDPLPERPAPPPADGIQGVIEKALRTAGLMR
ncbi:hypothetical protein DTW90_33535 [Neorhizobium sp. P12A]|uniref:extracellular catalytic domain type 1 short-chain-length polyhydroxyalkanoate depolymerase n=1 Tax=Neorhizobium sp. P12A TaxID=2268027 RepID=UPI0011EB9F7B|nr:PHB depolymerase family esterase [Neorhizobium sp. P12A]KAA0687382.1 hypothetical protein DTW90_33535 [Neorhizobium sp. P12A]